MNKRPEIRLGDWVNISSDTTPLLAVVTRSEIEGAFGIGKYHNLIHVEDVIEIRQDDGTVWTK